MKIQDLKDEQVRIGSKLKIARIMKEIRSEDVLQIDAHTVRKLEKGEGGNISSLVLFADAMGYQIKLVPKLSEQTRILNEIESTF